MDVLLNCVGQSDPYNDYSGKKIPGPILTVLEERRFDAVALFWTPGGPMNRFANKTREAVLKLGFPPERVPLVRLNVHDPADFEIMPEAMREAFAEVRKLFDPQGARYFAQISSGTPQMQWSWIVLALTRVIPAELIGVRPRYISDVQPPYSYKLDLTSLEQTLTGTESERLRAENSRLRAELARLTAELDLRTGGAGAAALEPGPGFSLPDYLESEKRRLYAAAIAQYPDNAAAAARALGIKPHTFRKEAARMGLRPRSGRNDL